MAHPLCCSWTCPPTPLKAFEAFIERIKETATRVKEIDPFTEAGSLAYTTVFAIPGIIIPVLAIVGYFYDANEVPIRCTRKLVY